MSEEEPTDYQIKLRADNIEDEEGIEAVIEPENDEFELEEKIVVKKPRKRTVAQKKALATARAKKLGYKAQAAMANEKLAKKEEEIYELRKIADSYRTQQDELKRLKDQIDLHNKERDLRVIELASKKANEFKSVLLESKIKPKSKPKPIFRKR